ncbi:hypothetical protein ABPG72_019957 [Tetrahymena utriculariae]
MEIESNTQISYHVRVQVLYESGIKKPETIKNRIKPFYDVSLRTVQRTVKQLREDVDMVEEQEYDNSNRFILNDKDREKIKKLLDNNMFLTVSEIKQKLHLECHDTTINNELLRIGFSYKNINQIPFQPANYQSQRIKFANECKNINWNRVVFIDECSVWRNQAKKKCWMQENQKNTVQVQKYPQKVHVFGAFCSKRIITMHIFEGTLTGEMYKQILMKHFFPKVQNIYPQNDFTLLQDKDPKHESKVVQDYLNFKKCDRFRNWPPNSPDLNPIENIGVQ